MKALAVALAVILSSLVSAQTTTNAYVSGSFVMTNGAVAEVDVFRYQDPTTNLITTSLFYNTCPQPSTNQGCQQGYGVIPNSAFQGLVYSNPNRPDSISLSVDTNAVPGFRNYLCFNDQYFYCAIQSPTSGGVIVMSWTRTNAFATIDTYVEKQYKFGRLDTSSNFVQSEFSATPAGSFFGSSVGAPVTPTGITIGTSANSQTLKAKFGALKNR